ncbi:MAG TPA: PIN domain-containing protein, partial [Candidatus Nanoarchaeia archaeon]|nr:PIN domain-containing protein [Candidatus Nanoarchaeia archaeon]
QGEQSALEAYAQISRTKIIELSSQLALEAAEISLLTKLGIADSLIVATAKAFDAKVVTSDKHLKELNGVKFIGHSL